MIYEYENSAGERREIIASMKNCPPEVVVFLSDGDWRPAGSVPYHPGERTPIPATNGEVFHRVYGERMQTPIVTNPAIRRTKDGLPVSRFLPARAGGEVVTDGGRKIKVHADGMRTDLRGRPIVATREDQKRVEAHYGVERE